MRCGHFIWRNVAMLLLVHSATFGNDLFEIREIRFDPAAKGKNAVEVEVLNLSDQPRLFGMHVYTVALIGPGEVGRGWGTNYFAELEPAEKKWCRFPFRIQGEVENDTYARLRFFAPESREALESEAFFQEVKVFGDELERLDAVQKVAQPASMQQRWTAPSNPGARAGGPEF